MLDIGCKAPGENMSQKEYPEFKPKDAVLLGNQSLG